MTLFIVSFSESGSRSGSS